MKIFYTIGDSKDMNVFEVDDDTPETIISAMVEERRAAAEDKAGM